MALQTFEHDSLTEYQFDEWLNQQNAMHDIFPTTDPSGSREFFIFGLVSDDDAEERLMIAIQALRFELHILIDAIVVITNLSSPGRSIGYCRFQGPQILPLLADIGGREVEITVADQSGLSQLGKIFGISSNFHWEEVQHEMATIEAVFGGVIFEIMPAVYDLHQHNQDSALSRVIRFLKKGLPWIRNLLKILSQWFAAIDNPFIRFLMKAFKGAVEYLSKASLVVSIGDVALSFLCFLSTLMTYKSIVKPMNSLIKIRDKLVQVIHAWQVLVDVGSSEFVFIQMHTYYQMLESKLRAKLTRFAQRFHSEHQDDLVLIDSPFSMCTELAMDMIAGFIPPVGSAVLVCGAIRFAFHWFADLLSKRVELTLVNVTEILDGLPLISLAQKVYPGTSQLLKTDFKLSADATVTMLRDPITMPFRLGELSFGAHALSVGQRAWDTIYQPLSIFGEKLKAKYLSLAEKANIIRAQLEELSDQCFESLEAFFDAMCLRTHEIIDSIQTALHSVAQELSIRYRQLIDQVRSWWTEFYHLIQAMIS